jgi:HEAT repeat protein
VVCFEFAASAEVVILTTGRALKGMIISEDTTSITLKTDNKSQIISKETVKERISDEAFAKRVEQLIKLLGDDDWQTREKTTEALRQLGAIVAPDLEIATKNPDFEVVYRAKSLLREMGLYHHTPSALWENIIQEVKPERSRKRIP